MTQNAAVDHSLTILRQDAIDRGLDELVITLGWSIIRLRSERIRMQDERIAGLISSRRSVS